MASLFREFSQTYHQFRELFPKHPLTEQLRSRIGHGKFPSDQWLKARTKTMKDLMTPVWLRAKENGAALQKPDSLDPEA